MSNDILYDFYYSEKQFEDMIEDSLNNNTVLKLHSIKLINQYKPYTFCIQKSQSILIDNTMDNEDDSHNVRSADFLINSKKRYNDLEFLGTTSFSFNNRQTNTYGLINMIKNAIIVENITKEMKEKDRKTYEILIIEILAVKMMDDFFLIKLHTFEKGTIFLFEKFDIHCPERYKIKKMNFAIDELNNRIKFYNNEYNEKLSMVHRIEFETK